MVREALNTDHGYGFEGAVAEYDHRLKQLVSHPNISRDIKKYYVEYIDHVVQEFAAVDNDEDQILAKYNKGGWRYYNLRHGVASIVGEIGEMVAAMYYAGHGHLVRRCTLQVDQVAGKDLEIRMPAWSRWYSVSVKVRKVYNDSAIYLRDQDFPLTTTPPHRIAYVMLDKNRLFQCDYPSIQRYFKEASSFQHTDSIRLSVIDFRTFIHYRHDTIRP